MFEKRIRASGAIAFPTLLLAVLTACAVPDKNKLAISGAAADLKPEKILATMEHVADWQIAQAPRYRTTDWTQGALYAGMMALDRVSPSPRFRDAVYRAGAINQWKLGPNHYNADDHCVGQMYAEMAMRLNDPRMIAPMRAQFDSILAKPSPVVSLDFTRREAGDRWSWCDALFMAPPAWTRLWSATGDRRYLDYAVSNWWITSEFLYDDVEHLFYRDSTYFNRIEANGRRVFWGRGNGWVMGGLVRVLEDLPKDHPDRDRFLKQFRDMAAKILKCQQRDGLWRSSLLDPESYPLKETSGSGFYTYALAWGVNEGVLDRSRYEPAVNRAWTALLECVTPEGKLTHVQPIGADPKKFDVTHSDVYGVGAFLLAGSEVYRLNGGKVLYHHSTRTERVVGAKIALADEPFDKVIERYREVVLGNEPDWSQEKSSARQLERLRDWIDSLRADGTWPNIDYANQDRSSWNTATHLARTRALARALADQRNPLHDDPQLESVVIRALDLWLAKRFRNPNWWWNQIGVPATMADIVVLLGDRLDERRRTAALEVVAQSGPPRGGTGANTIWIADIALQYAALSRDARLLADCSRILADEIKITRQDGVQPDFSFHQHQQRLQQFSYGRPYLLTSTRVAWQLHGTPWALPEDKISILCDLALEGDQWMCRGIYTVPSTLDRSASRPGALRQADLRECLEQLAELAPSRRAALEAFRARQEGNGAPLIGARIFPLSDFTTFHRPTFSLFVKTLSDRTFPTEVGLNSEHLKGALQNCGDHYLMRDGLEYLDLAPVWDWQRLPGLTYADGAGKPRRLPFVGGVTDGASAVTVMNVAFSNTNGAALAARKFWAAHEDLVICLVGGVEASGPIESIRTTMDQCHLRGPVTIADADGTVREFSGSASDLEVRWVHHSGFAYAPLDRAKVSLRTGPATGSWRSINQAQSAQPVTLPVFLLTLDHGTKSGGFVVTEGSADEAARLFASPAWKVLRNDASIQAVQFNDGAIGIAFWSAGELATDSLRFQVDRPCVVWHRNGRTWISDPTQSGGPLRLMLNGKNFEQKLPAEGSSVAFGG